MDDAARGMLAECLDALAPARGMSWSSQVGIVLSSRGVTGSNRDHCSNSAPWTITDPAEAQETLVARGLLPEGWGDPMLRGWHDHQARDDGWGDWRDVVRPAPRTIPDLVAVASLGVPALMRAETLAREACAALREHGCPQPERVVWRVGKRRERDDKSIPLAWWAREGGAKVSMADVLSVDGIWYPAKGPETWQHATRELWVDGLALDAINPDAVRIVVPPVGGVQ